MPSTSTTTTTANAIEYTTPVFRTDDNNLTSTVWPNLIETTTMANQITHNNDQILFHFGWIDYGLFAALLGISTLIGVFFGFFSKHKQNNTSEYIFGGRSMKILPVATSMIASLV